jgi:hypothetical protein
MYFGAAGGRQTVLLNSTVTGGGWTHMVFTYDA